ncbi:MAG: DUF2283 domain-containing protein [Desulfurococcales archaeon]|nr:DUF2283 domain-containing protein [Desulfurococcales archaeon]MEB3764639.1 DUF2283 domain-containing protein [Desulfurococcales archaeon]
MSEEDRLKEYQEALNRARELKVADIEKLWIEYDKQSDILYINFGMEEPDESIMIGDDVVVGIKDGKIVGITIFEFSKRAGL